LKNSATSWEYNDCIEPIADRESILFQTRD